MATSVYTRTFWPGADGTAWPAEWTPSGSAGYLAEIRSTGLYGQTSAVGGYADLLHWDLTAAGTTALTDYGVVGRFHWPNPLVEQGMFLYLRTSNDWINGDNPDTWVRCSQDYQGRCDIKHRLASGTTILDASGGLGTIPMTGGTSNWFRFEVVGNTLSAKWWQNSTTEPPGWTLTATMASSIVPGPGRLKFNLLGGAAAGVTTWARLVQIDVYDLSSSGGTSPPAFVASPARLHRNRARRRR